MDAAVLECVLAKVKSTLSNYSSLYEVLENSHDTANCPEDSHMKFLMTVPIWEDIRAP